MIKKSILGILGIALLQSCIVVKSTKYSSSDPQQNQANTGTTITFKGNPIKTVGQLPNVGTSAPKFQLTNKTMEEVSLNDFIGKYIVLNIFPSIDTKVCSASVRHFNQDAADLPNTVVLCISKDLPFAQERFCGAEGIKNVMMLSDFRNNFGKMYGVEMSTGAMKGLLSRAIVVINPEGKITYQEQVSDISHEPNYEAALSFIPKSRK